MVTGQKILFTFEKTVPEKLSNFHHQEHIAVSNNGISLYLLSQGQLPKDTAEMSSAELLSDWLTPDLETNSQITRRQTKKKKLK